MASLWTITTLLITILDASCFINLYAYLLCQHLILSSVANILDLGLKWWAILFPSFAYIFTLAFRLFICSCVTLPHPLPVRVLLNNVFLMSSRFMNQYFLLIACLQLWPLITPVNPASTWGPLIFIFAVSATKEGWDDYNRYLSDEKANEKEVWVVKRGIKKLVWHTTVFCCLFDGNVGFFNICHSM